MTLDDAAEKCTLTAEGDGVGAKLLWVGGMLGVFNHREKHWRSVSAFVSAYVSSGERTNENDKWVVKVVHCPEAQKPQLKSVETVFTTDWGGSEEMRRKFQYWVVQRGFDLLTDLY